MRPKFVSIDKQPLRRALTEMPRELITRASSGDRIAQEEVLREVYVYVRRLLYRLVGPSPDLEDLEQMTLTRIAGSLNDLTLEGTFHVWVNRICVNAVRDYIRRRVRVRRFEERQDPTEQLATDLEAGQAAKADLTHCYRALERLSPDHRAVFVLKAVMGHSIEEIAEIMGAARSTTRLRLYYARKAFYKAMVALRPEEAE